MSIELRVKTSRLYMSATRLLVRLGEKITNRYNKLGEVGQIIVLCLLGIVCIGAFYVTCLFLRETAVYSLNMIRHIIRRK